ncbi:hypothetical protein RV11_GL003494 [Enterococcus phoeniculicola]|uniref:Uncharacterized protein n=1 Tax=Enterococcus phoeniculicola ATCC BAA-412 TaxID=1158610 RepID=R3W3I7_9ENTE|nr:hypothetical protein [Enterococcus phoeniculicola]EOL42011.1 hypothetical protein UC3_02359 [Enterococcus phoeniculicola ATCC BAA-412]EOT79710.1 hypothetical protein I589_01222 [Enterococcus phoeniculicola ATCC BAA-412]OJG71773.1 hypothetical protein RV11_GL003494 [Enterococcus phoeniculicola]
MNKDDDNLIEKEASIIKQMQELKEIQDNKSMEEVAELFWNMITIYGLKMDELASLNFYIMKRSLETPANKVFLKERMNLDVEKLGVDGILQVQRALTVTYMERLANDSKRKD